MAIDREIQQWCLENNWTEPRRLENGTWVAFPPAGVIETPLPIQPSVVSEPRTSRLENLVSTLILVVAALIIGAIAIVIFPFFVVVIIVQMIKKSRF